MKSSFVSVLVLIGLFCGKITAFGVSKYQAANDVTRLSSSDGNMSPDRRSFLQNIIVGGSAAVVLGNVGAQPALASGGATAGGAYLLSAKQRYNDRVKASLKGLMEAQKAMAAGDSKPAKAYFSSEEGGSWKDLTAAGYLLSNAFRRSSTTAPDSLPAVKKYKAFVAQVDAYQKALKKKGAAAASDVYPQVEAALNIWLEEIELPSASEL